VILKCHAITLLLRHVVKLIAWLFEASLPLYTAESQ